MRFLFRLDLSLHAGAGKKIGILIFASKHGLGFIAHDGSCRGLYVQAMSKYWSCAPPRLPTSKCNFFLYLGSDALGQGARFPGVFPDAPS